MPGSTAARGAPPDLTDEQCRTVFDLHNLDQQRLAAIGAATNEVGLGADFADASTVNLIPAGARELAGLLEDGIRAQRGSETPAFLLQVENAAIRFDAALAAALRSYARRVGPAPIPRRRSPISSPIHDYWLLESDTTPCGCRSSNAVFSSRMLSGRVNWPH